MTTYRIHSDTPQFKTYHNSIFTEALVGINKSASLTCDFKQLLSTAANMQNTEQTISAAKLTPLASPKDGLIGMNDHFKEYALPYADEETAYHERYKTPDAISYRLHERFVEPDCKVPDFPKPETTPTQQNGVDKLRSVFTPARESARIQNDLRIISGNANMFREYTALLSESIAEMEGEIGQMKMNAALTKREIKFGEPFNAWMRLNLKPELSALGLDPKTATMWDLTNKLGQLAPESQTNIQTKSMHLEEQVALE